MNNQIIKTVYNYMSFREAWAGIEDLANETA